MGLLVNPYNRVKQSESFSAITAEIEGKNVFPDIWSKLEKLNRFFFL